MIDVFYTSPKGASIGRSFPDETALLAFISRLHKPAVILVKGVHVGKVFKTESGWGWFYEPEKVTPNKVLQSDGATGWRKMDDGSMGAFDWMGDEQSSPRS